MLASSVLAHQSASAATKLVINIPSYTLSVLAGDNVVKTYPVAVGKPSAPTPVGKFRIISKVVNPTWYPPDGSKPVPPGADNPLGRRWLGFLPNGYGIHGNNNASSIGKAVSLGCVRMHNADVEELFGCISAVSYTHLAATFSLFQYSYPCNSVRRSRPARAFVSSSNSGSRCGTGGVHASQLSLIHI